jgi:hypothetical protein
MEISLFLLTAMPVGEFLPPALAAAFPIVSGCCCNQLDMLGSLVIKQLARGGLSQSRKGEVFRFSFHEFSRKLQTVRTRTSALIAPATANVPAHQTPMDKKLLDHPSSYSMVSRDAAMNE